MRISEYQIIDSDNYQEAGIELMTFPGGEPHVKFNKPVKDDVFLFLKIRTWEDAGWASLVMDSLDHFGTIAFLPYFPGARQDRREPKLGPLTLKVMKRLFGFDNFTGHLVTFDGHSKVLWGTIDGNYMPHELLQGEKLDYTGIIAPDEGAVVRAGDLSSALVPNAHFIRCSKRRDSKTGRLSGYEMPHIPQEGRYLIVDDICDGGGTFNLLAEEWKKQGLTNSKLELFVSHGIFSKGVDNLDPVIEKIYTTDSWCKLENTDRLEVIPLRPLFDRIIKECENATQPATANRL